MYQRAARDYGCKPDGDCMPCDSRLLRAIHTLLHMEQAAGPLTSKATAGMPATDPAVVRRTMAGLRQHGIVSSAN